MKRSIPFICIMLVFMAVLGAAGCGRRESGETPSSALSVYTVSFDANGGNYVPPARVKAGGTLNEPTPPTRSGYNFAGWYLFGAKWDFASPVNDNITLTAKWYDASALYRVTVGVDTMQSRRGSAEIVGYDGGNARFGAGAQVTVRAAAREGFKFIGWVDDRTGYTVSLSENYTFIVEEDRVLRAAFEYSLSGLDIPENAKLWEYLGDMDFSRGKLTVSGASGERQIVSDGERFLYKDEAGDGVLVITRGGAAECYSVEGGAVTGVKEGSEALAKFLPYIIGTLSEDGADRLRIALYTSLMGGAAQDGNALSARLHAGEYLEEISAQVAENADKTLFSLVYPYVKQTLDGLLSETDDALPVGGIDKLSVSALINAYARVSDSGVSVESVRESVYGFVDALSEFLSSRGFDFDGAYYKNAFEEILAGSVADAAERLNTAPSLGGAGDIPEGASMPATLVYALASNFTLGDLVLAVTEVLKISGTEWDITSAEAAFKEAYADIRFTETEYGVEVYAEIPVGEEVKTIAYTAVKEGDFPELPA